MRSKNALQFQRDEYLPFQNLHSVLFVKVEYLDYLNRLLILGKLFGDLKIENLSNSQDAQLLQKALNEDSETVDIHHAGTAMRFLTSFYAIQEGRKTILAGSERMNIHCF